MVKTLVVSGGMGNRLVFWFGGFLPGLMGESETILTMCDISSIQVNPCLDKIAADWHILFLPLLPAAASYQVRRVKSVKKASAALPPHAVAKRKTDQSIYIDWSALKMTLLPLTTREKDVT